MSAFLQALLDAAPAALAAIVTACSVMAFAFVCYSILLLVVYPRINGYDPGGWPFAGALTLSVAFLNVCAAMGIGKASETVIGGAASIGISLGTVVTSLIMHRASNRWADRPPAPPPPPATTTLTVETAPGSPPASPAASATATATVTTESTP